MNRARHLFAALSCGMTVTAPTHGATAPTDAIPALRTDPRLHGTVPVPTAERDLPTVVAERWFALPGPDTALEGAAFDADGDLLFCDAQGGRVLRLSAERRLSVLLDERGLGPGGLVVRPDGRIAIAAVAAGFDSGSVIEMDASGRNRRVLVPPEAGYVPNDVVADGRGGFYLTDFKGAVGDLRGGVYHVSADLRTVTPIVTGLARANGIALDAAGKVLWVTEYGQNRLLRIDLTDRVKVAPLGVKVAYHFIGPAPDSMRVDSDGRVYVAMSGQGRVLIFSPGGIPIGQVLMPDRDDGHHLGTTSIALKPGTNDLYVVAADRGAGRGAAVFRARVFPNARPLPLR